MVLVGAMVVVGIVASVPKEVWGTLFVAGAVVFVIRVVVKMMGAGSRAKPVSRVVLQDDVEDRASIAESCFLHCDVHDCFSFLPGQPAKLTRPLSRRL